MLTVHRKVLYCLSHKLHPQHLCDHQIPGGKGNLFSNVFLADLLYKAIQPQLGKFHLCLVTSWLCK